MNSRICRKPWRSTAGAGWAIALYLVLVTGFSEAQDNPAPPANAAPPVANPPAAAPPADRPQQPLQAPSQLQGPGGPGGAGGPGGPGSTVLGDRVSLQFPLNPVNDILNIYERLINKPIVKDSSIFNGPQVSLVTPSEVSRDDAIRLIEAALLVNGYILVIEPEADTVKILLGGARQGGGSPSFSEGVVIYTDPNLLPDGESLVGFFMDLEFVDPEDAGTIFSNHIVLNEFGRITPVTNPRGLLITETSPIVRQLIRLKAIIDHPVDDAPLITEFVQLEYAESNVVAQIIQAAMDARMEERQRQSESRGTVTGTQARTTTPQQAQSNQQQGQQAQQNQGNNNSNANASAQSAKGRNVMNGIGTADQPAAQLIPDDRLNRIMIVASPTDAAYILELIQQFDRPLDNHQPVERKLKYVKANDILSVLVDVLQDTGTGETMLPGGRQIQTRPTPVTSSQLSTLTGTNQTSQNNQNRTQQQSTASATDEVGGREDQIAFPENDVSPISVLVGKTRIIADRQSNSIIVAGTRESEMIVLDMIDRLDHRPVQVYLATVIGELTLNDDVQFGVDYIQRFSKWNGRKPGSGGFTSGNINGRPDIIGNPGSIANMADMITTTPFGPASGLNFYGQIGESLDVIITALEATKRFKVLSRPVVYTQNGKRAEITSGQEVPYPETSLTETNNPSAVQSTVAYKDVVLKLEVLPTINEDDEVTLDIVQINDRVIGQQVIDTNEIPIIGKQELNTTVSVANRSTIILGGLISESKDEEDKGIPFLKDIPIIGYAAKTTSVGKTRSELMIFIQPIVVRGDKEATIASYDEDVRSEVGEDAAASFPEPGNPTIMHRAEEIRDVEVEENPFKKLGQRLFGKQKIPREPLP